MKKEKQRKVILALKENRQALELFLEKYPEKNEAFKYLLTTFQLAISAIKRELYPSKHFNVGSTLFLD